MRTLFASFVFALFLLGCDTSQPPEEWDFRAGPNKILASTNLPEWTKRGGHAQYAICRTSTGRPDTLFAMGQSLAGPDGVGLGYWKMLAVKRGTSVVPVESIYVRDGGENQHISKQFKSSFIESDDDIIVVAELHLDFTHVNTIQFTSIDPVTMRAKGTFDVQYVLNRDRPVSWVPRKFPDTVYFQNGTFEIEPEQVSCAALI